MKEVIAVDLGGSNLRVALVRERKIVDYMKKETPKDKKKLISELTESIDGLMNKNVKGIGVSSAGPLINGVIKNPPNLPLKNFDLKNYLKKKYKVRVEIGNDANCVALAEAELGCKKKNFFILTIGTGIGGGVVIEGEVYEGQGFGGELGHVIINDENDFEGMWKKSRRLINRTFKKEILIKDLIKIHNKKSRVILEDVYDIFARGIGSLINIFDPEIVILAGGLRETGETFLKPVRSRIKKYVVFPRKTKVVWSKLEHPGILGASLLID